MYKKPACNETDTQTLEIGIGPEWPPVYRLDPGSRPVTGDLSAEAVPDMVCTKMVPNLVHNWIRP